MEYKRFTEKGKLFIEDIDKVYEAYWKLQELEDKIEQGTLVEFPCRIGDKMYSIDNYTISGEQVVGKITVDGFRLGFDWRGILVQDNATGDWYEYGKDAFLTREEAEKRLKE